LISREHHASLPGLGDTDKTDAHSSEGGGLTRGIQDCVESSSQWSRHFRAADCPWMVVGGETDGRHRSDRFDAIIRQAQNRLIARRCAVRVRDSFSECYYNTDYVHGNAVWNLLWSKPGMHSGHWSWKWRQDGSRTECLLMRARRALSAVNTPGILLFRSDWKCS
jgi:hypothetical protein